MSSSLIDTDKPPLTGKAATQDRILEAATQLFIDQGFEKTTVAEIAPPQYSTTRS